mmetsp:Transcript_111262/g.314036  ORF Transcript_111262/g.314036 Transcript_111262/m.314036 type:complete len:371 (+) Transcript_111262:76-1188(+)
MAHVLVLAPDETRLSQEAVNTGCMNAMIRALAGAPGIETCRRARARDLQDNALDAADVLILGGGESIKMRDLLKPAAPSIRSWLQGGGGRGLVGICAGAVVASSDPKRGLQFTMGVRLREDNLCAVAGLEGEAVLEPLGPMGSWLFPEGGTRFCYENGPLLQTAGNYAEAWALYGNGFIADSLIDPNTCPDSLNPDGALTKQAWLCTTCGSGNTAGRKKCGCCGAKLQAQRKQLRLQEMLARRMPGCAAVVGISHGESGPCNSRAVLFGPHPEFSSSVGGWAVLQRAVLWSCSKEHLAITKRGRAAVTPRNRGHAPQTGRKKRPDFETFLEEWAQTNPSEVFDLPEVKDGTSRDAYSTCAQRLDKGDAWL